jgi:proteasome accessory factor C
VAERAADRLLRLIGLVAHLDAHGEASVDELAERFAVSTEQVLSDVETIWMTGTPGYQHDDLIDFDAFRLDEGHVQLTQARGMVRPLRLGGREAVALIAATRALASSIGAALDDTRRELVESALHKLTVAAGSLADSAPVDVRLGLDPDHRPAQVVARGIAEGRRLRLRYVNAADEVSVRTVDPIRLVADDQTGYLVAWCLAADAERLFRLDRVVQSEVLDDPAVEHDVSGDADRFVPTGGERVTLHLRGRGRWIAETTPVVAVRDRDDGTFEVDLDVVSEPWLERLLLSAGQDVLQVRPRRIAQSVAATARAALDAYRRELP